MYSLEWSVAYHLPPDSTYARMLSMRACETPGAPNHSLVAAQGTKTM